MCAWRVRVACACVACACVCLRVLACVRVRLRVLACACVGGGEGGGAAAGIEPAMSQGAPPRTATRPLSYAGRSRPAAHVRTSTPVGFEPTRGDPIGLAG